MAIPVEIINRTADLLLRTIALMQQISGKSREEVLRAIADEGIKTDELLKKLR